MDRAGSSRRRAKEGFGNVPRGWAKNDTLQTRNLHTCEKKARANTNRHRELSRQVGVAIGGEDRVGNGEWLGVSRPNGGERVGRVAALRRRQAGVDILDRKIEEVVDVVEEAAAVYLVGEAISDHIVRKNKIKSWEKGAGKMKWNEIEIEDDKNKNKEDEA